MGTKTEEEILPASREWWKERTAWWMKQCQREWLEYKETGDQECLEGARDSLHHAKHLYRTEVDRQK